MPPFTASTWTVALRRAAFYARQSLANRAKAKSPRFARARAIAQTVLEETFPNLVKPTFSTSASHALYTARASAYTLRPISLPTTPFQRAGMAVRTAPFRLGSIHPRGAAVVGQVGLGSARTFASTAAGSTTAPAAAANASILLRAFVGLDDKTLPRATKYDSYPRARRQRMRRRPGRLSRVDVAKSRTIRDIEYYFPRALQSPPPAPLPPLPENLVTDGVTTTLALALAPSLQELLVPTPDLSYAEAEVGVSVFSHLLKGILPLHELYSLHGSHHVLPLLYKLTSLGVLSTDLGSHTVRLEVIPDPEGRPDVLHIVFPGRSTRDIKTLLGDTLGEDPWHALYETVPLTVEEDEAMTNHWDTDSSSLPDTVSSGFSSSLLSTIPSTPEDSYLSLVIPRIDVGAPMAPEDSWQVPDPSEIEVDYATQAESGTWTVYPDSIPSPRTDSDASSTSTSSDSFTPSFISPAWSVAPSEADSELESLMEELEWSERQEELERVSRPESPEMSWIGGGGYGLLQPW